jgi:hypothetical protein
MFEMYTRVFKDDFFCTTGNGLPNLCPIDNTLNPALYASSGGLFDDPSRL